MPAPAFVARLNEQIGHEFAAHQQYLACAIYYDGETLPQLARFFYGQALEERAHATMMVRYLLDTDGEITVPGVAAPVSQFDDFVAPIALAVEQERRQIVDLARDLAAVREELEALKTRVAAATAARTEAAQSAQAGQVAVAANSPSAADREQLAVLKRKGDDFIAAGDFVSARAMFQRAAEVLAGIDPVSAASIGPRIAISVAVIAASAIIIALVWRNL